MTIDEQLLHPEFAEHIGSLRDILQKCKETKAGPLELQQILTSQQEWFDSYQWAMNMLITNRVTGLGGSAFAVPLLHPEACSKLVSFVKDKHYQPNPDEEADYQIPELLASHISLDCHDMLAGLIPHINIWSSLAFQTETETVTSIQFARYRPEDTDKGNWHHDVDSDVSVVISLNPGEFEGGGTDIMLHPAEYYSLAPLPQGYALILPGKLLQHRGAQVTAGERHLLVFWLNTPIL